LTAAQHWASHQHRMGRPPCSLRHCAAGVPVPLRRSAPRKVSPRQTMPSRPPHARVMAHWFMRTQKSIGRCEKERPLACGPYAMAAAARDVQAAGGGADTLLFNVGSVTKARKTPRRRGERGRPQRHVARIPQRLGHRSLRGGPWGCMGGPARPHRCLLHRCFLMPVGAGFPRSRGFDSS
jgi:hypothetical protein